MTDKYFVATDELKDTLVKKGYQTDRIEVSGIPIRNMFQLRRGVRGDTFNEDKKSPRKSVLFMAGIAKHLVEAKELVQTLLSVGDIEVLAVCGMNEKLKKQLDDHFMQHDRVRVFGYVDRMDKLMEESHCILTKAGGVTLTEAISMTLPAIVFRPVPGQESENAAFMARNGMAIEVNHLEDLADAFRNVISPEGASRMRHAQQKLAKQHAGATIVSSIVHDLQYPVWSISQMKRAGGILFES